MSRSPVFAAEVVDAGTKLDALKAAIKRPLSKSVFVNNEEVTLANLKSHVGKLAELSGCAFALMGRPSSTPTHVALDKNTLVLGPQGILRIEVGSNSNPSSTPAAAAAPITYEVTTPVGSDAGRMATPTADPERTTVKITVVDAWSLLSVLRIKLSDGTTDDPSATTLYTGSEARFNKRPTTTTIATLPASQTYVSLQWHNLHKSHSPFFTEHEMESVVTKYWSFGSTIARCCLNPTIRNEPRKYAVLRYNDKGFTCVRCSKCFNTKSAWKNHFAQHVADKIPTSVEWREIMVTDRVLNDRAIRALVDNPEPRPHMTTARIARTMMVPSVCKETMARLDEAAASGRFAPKCFRVAPPSFVKINTSTANARWIRYK